MPGHSTTLMLKGVGKKSEQRRREELSSRRVIDLAIGILMGLRGCSEKDAFDDLASAVRETGVGLGSLGAALADVVAYPEGSYPYRAEALHMWGYLLKDRVASAVRPV
jgi:hypothetical protein